MPSSLHSTCSTSRGDAPSQEAPSPTGRSSASQSPNASATALRAAHAIRQALDRDPDLAHANVIVTPLHDRVLVHGTVISEDTKSDLEHLADRAADAASIDFDLSVDPR